MVGFAEGDADVGADGEVAGAAQAVTSKATRIAPRRDRWIGISSLVVERRWAARTIDAVSWRMRDAEAARGVTGTADNPITLLTMLTVIVRLCEPA